MTQAGLSDLRAAVGSGKAFGCFAARDRGCVEAIIAAAQETGLPAALCIGYTPDVDFQTLSSTCCTAAGKTAMPVAVHLNHGRSLGEVLAALDAGCTSVMFDGSALDLESNITRTRECVQAAHAHGVEIEGEIGPLGVFSLDEARDFVARTGVDWLAVSVPAHWPFHAGIIEALAGLGAGLVLHGASKLTPDQRTAAIRVGVAKINAHSELDRALAEGVRQTPSQAAESFPNGLDPMYDAVRRTVSELMRSYALR
ncbi:class II fructose-bisphosphate aldolase [Oceanidesulfovibrio marinus]|uniref:Fructose-bisphosphate aldolase n=1 Tax=Oceanidesulfovibrio marinus TaxID=370038 RepID=A0ABX6NFE3_9BACT|nr:class II fructose-bisphosphate aldolase [Oceanidesulfovibrio marinus]QJT08753.1 hypothetical protein E8L03_07360 [Oceanidesulfovibrio marinus]